MNTDPLNIMLEAAASLNWMADSCQYLRQKNELRQRAQKLLDTHVFLIELIDAVRPAITEEGLEDQELNRLRSAFARIGAANG